MSAPLLALPVDASAQATKRVPKQRTLRTSSGQAANKTAATLLNYLPSLAEIKTKADDPERKKLSQPKEKLPTARRCRPGDLVCQEYWKKQAKPSQNIGFLIPREERPAFDSLSNLLVWQPLSHSSERMWWHNTSNLPMGLGARKPNADPAPMLMQGGVTYGDWPTEMTQGRNRIGGDDLFSGNYHWSVPIVGLPGRAGHDLGLGLAYNSHLWVKTLASNMMKMIDYSEVVGHPGGGFTVGLPFLRPYLHTSRGGLNAYLLVMPSGKAIEFIRRGGSSSSQVYETIDGSVMRLVVEPGANYQYLFFPDGTRLRFYNFQCIEV